ncbi:MAG: hypothetical protein IPH86_07410 [bacterium]|nr:hypothetical protein [bacterium]
MEIPVRDRWLSAICYLSFLVLVPMLSTSRSPLPQSPLPAGVRPALRRGRGALFILIIDGTIGRIPLLGFLVVIILRLAFFIAILGVSVMGFTRALFGETWRVPYLDELAERIPFGS